MAISIDTFFLDPDSQGTLQAQIQQMIAQGILAGRYGKGEKLPSSRKLAMHLGISRITVTLAYTELLSNDYLTSRGRSGYFVSQNAPEPPKFAPQVKRTEAVDWSRAIGQKFTGGSAPTKPVDWQKYKYPFIYGQVDKTLFDHANWRLCALQALGARDFSAPATRRRRCSRCARPESTTAAGFRTSQSPRPTRPRDSPRMSPGEWKRTAFPIPRPSGCWKHSRAQYPW